MEREVGEKVARAGEWREEGEENETSCGTVEWEPGDEEVASSIYPASSLLSATPTVPTSLSRYLLLLFNSLCLHSDG